MTTTVAQDDSGGELDVPVQNGLAGGSDTHTDTTGAVPVPATTDAAEAANGNGLEEGDGGAAAKHDDPPVVPADGANGANNVNGADMPPSEFPRPSALADENKVIWAEDGIAAESYVAIGKALAKTGDLYRTSSYGGGLLLASPAPTVPPTPISSATALNAAITERIRLEVQRNGKPKGSLISSGQANVMLRSELFLQHFRTIDTVTKTPIYLPDFTLSKPGYNDGGVGHRIFFAGKPAVISQSTDTIRRFLDSMPFATAADLANALGAALMVLLRNFWPGAKMLASIMGNKSHTGKTTCATFIAGRSRMTAVVYERTDWALHRAVVGALRHHPDTAVINIDNARLDRGSSFIESGFIEQFVTEPEPLLFATGSGGPTSRRNDLVVIITTNFGVLSADLANRALPIYLELAGNIEDLRSGIPNPRLVFLPAHAEAIESELHGMIHRWVAEGCPRDITVKHPFGPCAQAIGGILQVSGYTDFLKNYSQQKTVDDPIRKAIGILGAAHHASAQTDDGWAPAAEWARRVAQLGLVKVLIGEADRDSEAGRERGVGVVLTAHRDETVTGQTDSDHLVMRVQRARRRFGTNQPHTRYRFAVISKAAIPADDDPSPVLAKAKEPVT